MSIQWGAFRDTVEELQYEMMHDEQKCYAIHDHLHEQRASISEATTEAMEPLADFVCQPVAGATARRSPRGPRSCWPSWRQTARPSWC